MAQYDSLKDYMQLNHLDVISEGIYDYIKTSSDVELRINDLKILTQGKIVFMPPDIIIQSEITFKPFDILNFILGISCEESDADNNSIGVYYYNVMLTGSMSEKFSDLHVLAVEECTQSSLIPETVTSMFGLPDITVDKLEEEADRVHKSLYTSVKRNEEHRYRFEPVLIKEKFKKSDNMHMWPAELPEECLGQIRFEASSATIYDINDPCTPHPNYPIPANSILLNVKYYRNEIGCDDIITAAHELVHWEIHRDYMKLLQFLDDTYSVMECTSAHITLDDNMSLKEKARWYAEWQANELAIRVAMPKHLVEEAINEYENSISEIHHVVNSSIPHDGNYYENMIYKLHWDFNVPKEVMKIRLRQLGYDYADGTLVTVDDCFYPPFTFPRGTLKENETFVIDRGSYEQLMRENEEFAELINEKICVYTGYVVCVNNAKYIKYSIKGGEIIYELSDYAKEHADECCLIFLLYSKYDLSSVNTQAYLCHATPNHLIEYNKELKSEDSKNKKLLEIINEEIEKRKKDKELYDKMIATGIHKFSEALKYITENARLEDKHSTKIKLKKKDLAEYIGCDERTIQNYRNGEPPDTLEKVMMICLACETGPMVSNFLIEKSVGGIPDIDMKKIAYEFLLEHTDLPLSEWDRILAEYSLPPIRF